MSQDVCSHGIYLLFPEYSGLNTKGIQLWSLYLQPLTYSQAYRDKTGDVTSVMLKGTPSLFIPLKSYLIGLDAAYFSYITKSICGHATALVEYRIAVIVWCDKTRRRWGVI